MLVDVKGVVSGQIGTILLSTPKSTLQCPGAVVGGSTATTLTDSGFTSNLTATVKLLAVATGKGKVCYSSDVPFLSETNPTTPKPGTAYLLSCAAVGNVAPCVISITSGLAAVIAKVLVPAGDPTFSVVVPTGRLVWPSTFPNGKVGTTYSAHLLSKGGKAPFKWSIASGKLPPGLSINAPDRNGHRQADCDRNLQVRGARHRLGSPAPVGQHLGLDHHQLRLNGGYRSVTKVTA